MPLTLAVKHRLDNRIRISFSDEVKNFEKLKFQVMEHEGIESFSYNPVSQSALIHFDPEILHVHELLIRTAVAYSLENNLSPVKIIEPGKKDFITPKGLAAGISIMAALAIPFLSSNKLLKNAAAWASAATTAMAVLEHAAFDYRKKGSVDPEVLSLGLLINSVVNNNKMVLPSALTWISTFGRHFSISDNEGIVLEVNKKKTDGKKAYYHLSVSKLTNKGNVADLIYILAESFLNPEGGGKNSIFEGAKDLMNSHNEFIEGMGEKIDGMVLNFNQ